VLSYAVYAVLLVVIVLFAPDGLRSIRSPEGFRFLRRRSS